MEIAYHDFLISVALKRVIKVCFGMFPEQAGVLPDLRRAAPAAGALAAQGRAGHGARLRRLPPAPAAAVERVPGACSLAHFTLRTTLMRPLVTLLVSESLTSRRSDCPLALLWRYPIV